MGLFDAVANIATTYMNNQSSKSASTTAYNRNLEMWNLENEYNSPKQQMERLKEAGLNPNLVYGSGSVTGNTVGSPPQAQVAKTQPYDLSGFFTREQRAEQIELARESQYQAVRNQDIQNELARQNLFLRQRESDRQDELLAATLKNMDSNRDMTLNNYENINQDRLDKLKFAKYKEAHKQWEHRRDSLPAYFKLDPKLTFNYIGREPTLSDFY